MAIYLLTEGVATMTGAVPEEGITFSWQAITMGPWLHAEHCFRLLRPDFF